MENNDDRPRDAAHNLLVAELSRQCVYDAHLPIPNTSALLQLKAELSLALHRYKSKYPEPAGEPLKPGDFLPNVAIICENLPGAHERMVPRLADGGPVGVSWGVGDGGPEVFMPSPRWSAIDIASRKDVTFIAYRNAAGRWWLANEAESLVPLFGVRLISRYRGYPS